MGVLKVWAGTEWRAVGCGGGSTPGAPLSLSNPDAAGGTSGWAALPSGANLAVSGGAFAVDYDGSSSDLRLVSDQGSVVLDGGLSGLPVTEGVAYTATAAVYTNGFTGFGSMALQWWTSAGVFISASFGTATVALGTSPGTATVTATAPAGAGAARILALATKDSGGVTSSDVAYFDNLTWATADVPDDPGRLKLWTGSGWVRERCDDDTATARPLKVWDGTAWVTVACMVPV